MANTFKNAFSENVSNNSGSPTSVLTCPSANASKCVLIGMHLTNTSSNEITATVIMYDHSAGTNDITLVKDVPLPPNTMLAVLEGDKIILEEQDIVKVYASAASSCNAFVSYLLSDNT